MSCREGHIDALIYLSSIYSIDAREYDNYALRSSSQNGHVRILRVLKEEFGLGADDARANDNEALKGATTYVQIEAMRFLSAGYGLGAQDAQAWYNEIIHAAAASDNSEMPELLEVLEVLRNEYGLGAPGVA